MKYRVLCHMRAVGTGKHFRAQVGKLHDSKEDADSFMAREEEETHGEFKYEVERIVKKRKRSDEEGDLRARKSRKARSRTAKNPWKDV